MADFTGQNIQDTYQRVVQIDNGQLQDGTGSALVLLDVTASHAISASHEITFELSSSHAETADFLTPGNDINVRHITASGHISASGNIFADNVKTMGRNALGTAQHNSVDNAKGTLFTDANITQVQIGKGEINTSTIIHGDITASGAISASGNIHAGTRIRVDEMIAIGAPTTDILRFGAGATTIQVGAPTHSEPKLISLNGPVTASGDISASGTITGIINGGTF